jgi:hypothetical protein
MIVFVARQSNIEPDLQDQTNIALNLFNTILETANPYVEPTILGQQLNEILVLKNNWRLDVDNLEINSKPCFFEIWPLFHVLRLSCF